MSRKTTKPLDQLSQITTKLQQDNQRRLEMLKAAEEPRLVEDPDEMWRQWEELIDGLRERRQ